MPLVDMPLEELMRYQGRNPCPADMDRYWDAALREMRTVDAKVELVPHAIDAPFAECYNLYFTGVSGARIHSQYIKPKNAEKPHPAVLMFHGYTGGSGEWSDKFRYTARGYTVAALDCRGQGGSSEDTGAVKGTTYRGHIIRGLDDEPGKLLFRNIFLDTAQLAGIIMAMPEVDQDRVGAIGGSQGGGLTLACAALEPRIKRAVSIYPFLCDYQRVWEMDLATAAYEELSYYFRMFDARHEREREIFTRLGYIDAQHLAKRVRAEVLLAIGLMDTVCPPSTQFAAYNKLQCRKSLLIYPDFGHESLPGIADKSYEFLAGL